MIKRSYFLSAKILHDDGHGSYTFHYSHTIFKSWFPDSVYAFSRLMEKAKDAAKSKGLEGKPIEVVSFNRC